MDGVCIVEFDLRYPPDGCSIVLVSRAISAPFSEARKRAGYNPFCKIFDKSRLEGVYDKLRGDGWICGPR
jgi:hypothetical protein